MSKFLEPRSYVRTFNAASMADAIKLADEALRIDGVTVAVWKNYAEMMPPEFHEWVSEIIKELNAENQKTTKRHCKHYMDDVSPEELLKLTNFWGEELHDAFEFRAYINKSFSLINTTIHQDSFRPNLFRDDPNLLFNGNFFRALFNIEGRPTKFMRTKLGDEKYSLRKGSLAFSTHKKEGSENCDSAAWHQGVDKTKPRAFMISDMRVRVPV